MKISPLFIRRATPFLLALGTVGQTRATVAASRASKPRMSGDELTCSGGRLVAATTATRGLACGWRRAHRPCAEVRAVLGGVGEPADLEQRVRQAFGGGGAAWAI